MNLDLIEEKISQWLTDITNEGPIPEKCKTIYIGLFEGIAEYMIHFLGSVEFDPNDDDWALEKKEHYIPQHRYLKSGITTEIGRSDFQIKVISIIENLKHETDLILSQVEHIAIGFDNGGLIYL